VLIAQERWQYWIVPGNSAVGRSRHASVIVSVNRFPDQATGLGGN
jgi:hypothetical protein